MALIKEDFNWTKKAVVGMALLIQGGSVDSFGEQIKGDIYYEVGKRKTDGMVAILPTERNQKHEFANDIMKRKNKFN